MRRKEGFDGQKAIVLPSYIQVELRENNLTKSLFTTDIGYYPEAKYHYITREEGSPESILIYCVEGKGWVEVDGLTKRIGKGQFFVIKAGVPHRYGADEDEPWSIYWLHFVGDKSCVFVKNRLDLYEDPSSDSAIRNKRIRLFDELYGTLAFGSNVDNLSYSSICTWYLLGNFIFPTQASNAYGIDNDVVTKSINYMNNHLNASLTLNDIASFCNCSVSYFSLLFKKATTRTPIEYYNYLKMQRACQLLDFTTMNIKEIAISLNIEDPFYFSRVFKKVMGLSPHDYRNKKKG